MRERMSSEVKTIRKRNQIHVSLSHNLDPGLYDLALSLKTIIPDQWESVRVSQDGVVMDHKIGQDQSGTFVIYQAEPNREPVIITAIRN